MATLSLATEICIALAFALVCLIAVFTGFYWHMDNEIQALRERVHRLRHHARVIEYEVLRLVKMHRFFGENESHPPIHEPERRKSP